MWTQVGGDEEGGGGSERACVCVCAHASVCVCVGGGGGQGDVGSGRNTVLQRLYCVCLCACVWGGGGTLVLQPCIYSHTHWHAGYGGGLVVCAAVCPGVWQLVGGVPDDADESNWSAGDASPDGTAIYLATSAGQFRLMDTRCDNSAAGPPLVIANR